jgi:hypothetical protein
VGAVWIYSRIGYVPPTSPASITSTGSWTQKQKIVPSSIDYVKNVDTSDAVYFGHAVSFNNDGNILAVGAYADNSGVGATWIYRNTSTSFTFFQKLCATESGSVTSYSRTTPPDPITVVNQGYAVAVSGTNGNTIAVGGNGDSDNVGAVWIWNRASDSSLYSIQTKLVAYSYIGAFINQGSAVCLSDDGNTLVLGGPNDDGSTGAAWVYTRSGTTWTSNPVKKLVSSEDIGEFGFQGYSCGLSADGNTLVIGAPGDNANSGAAYIFV